MEKRLFREKRAYRFKQFARKAYAAFNSMHRVVNIGVITGCMLTFVHTTGTASEAQAVVIPDSIPDQEFDEVIITSSKAELTLNQSAKLVTVITSNEIERQPVSSIQDLLKSVVGLDVRQRGNNGVLAGISVRGGTFEQTAILLNGANLSNPQTAHYSLDLPINLSDIERIEIIEGPSSLLFGASAFSGGINIVTKNDSQSNAYFQAQAGMHQLVGGEARGAWKNETSSHSLSLGYNNSEGYIKNADYEILNSLWQSHWTGRDSKLDFQLGYNQKNYGANTFYSPLYPDQYDETRSLFASIRGESNGRIKFIPQLYWSRHYDEFHLFRPGTPEIPSWYTAPNYHITDVFGFNLNSQYKWKWGILNFGGELRNEGIRSSNLGKPVNEPKDKYTKKDNRTNISYFVEQTFLIDKLTLSLGVLANYNTSLDEDFSFYPNLSASYWLTDQLKAFASWNNATRMPTFTDLYYTGKTHKGNSDVKPEKSESFEAGLKYHAGIWSVQLSGFYFKGKNLIDWVKEQPGDLWESRNLTNIDKLGFEAHVGVRLSSSQLHLGYAYMNQDKDASGLISNYVLDYLRHKLTLGLSHPIYKGLTADWQFRYQKREGSYTQYIGTKEIGETSYPSFALVDLKLNWKKDKLNLFLKADNLFNVSYYDLGNIPQAGIWLQAGISYCLR